MKLKKMKNRIVFVLGTLSLVSTLVPVAAVQAATNPAILLDASTSATSVSPSVLGANQRYNLDGRGMFDSVNKEVYADFYASYINSGIKSMRYPGGTVANLFQWQRGVGNGNGTNPDSGLPQIHGMDMTPDPGNFNLDEALKFAENTGNELTYMYAMGNGSPADAANLVQYLNGTDSNNPYVQLRVSNGHTAPYHIKYFEIGNESGPGPQNYWLDGIPNSVNTWQNAYVNGGIASFTRQAVVLKTDWSSLKKGSYTSNGTAGQEVYAAYGPPTAGTDTLYVGGSAWTRVTSIAGYGPNDPVYQINYTSGLITFGDGVNGKIPPANATISISYSAQKMGYKDYYTAMKSVDPTIKIISNVSDEKVIQAFRDSNVPYDGMTMHLYTSANNPSSVADYYSQSMVGAGLTVNWVAGKQNALKNEPLSGGIVYPSEYGLSGNKAYPNYLLGLGAGLFHGKILMKFMQNGIQAADKHSLIDTWGVNDSLGTGNFAIFNNNNTAGSSNFTPSVTAEVFKLLANMTGETALNTADIVNMPKYFGSQNALDVLATKNANGDLFLLVLNEDNATSYTTKVTIANYQPGSTATVWKLGEGLGLDAYNTSGQAPTVVTQVSTLSVPGNEFTYTFPAHTMTAIKLNGYIMPPVVDSGTANYKMDETSGTTASDASGNNHTATLQSSGGTASWDANGGKVKGALHLAPTVNSSTYYGNYYASIPNFFDPAATDFSFAAWVKPDQEAASGTNQTIFAQEGTLGRSILYRTSTGKLNSFLGGVTTSTTGVIPIGSWTHVALVKSGSTVKMYLNGVLDKTSTVATESATGDFRLGAHKAPSYNSANWNGWLDEVQLTKSALTDAQIQNMYNGLAPIAQYRMNEYAGSSASDSSGNNHPASLVASSGGILSWTPAGKAAGALNFVPSGSNSYGNYYASIPNLFDPAATNFTISAWVNLAAATATGTNQAIFAQEGSSGRNLLYRDAATGTLRSFLGGVVTTTTGAVPMGEWTHVALVNDGGTIQLYINGVADGTAAVTVNSSTGNFRIGANKSPSSSNANWNGMIDELQIFQAALTPTEISHVANGVAP
ncbi:LamG-like jellyroll fold domain-containing protein [Paenibacillus oryzisoli]|uniref:LamG-like jellyroll fold domain-containing protein n=1 Tax=Paenibacillus oryzisoli TaxID=1850517 RepID=UPI003D270A3C